MNSGRKYLEALEPRRLLSSSGYTPRIYTPQQVLTKEDMSAALNIRVIDPDNTPITVRLDPSAGQVRAKATTGVLLQENGDGLEITGGWRNVNKSLGSVVYQPPKDANGIQTITIRASDGRNEALKKIKISISPVNDAPSIDIKARAVSDGGVVSWESAPIRDPDSKTVTVSISSENGFVRSTDPAAKNIGGRTEITGSPEYVNKVLLAPGKINVSSEDGGDTRLTLSVSDGKLKTTAVVKVDASRPRLDDSAAASITARLAGKDPSTSKAIFSLMDHESATYTRNKDCWAGGIDLTPISPWNSSGGNLLAGTLISSRHIVYATHYQMPVGTKIRFVTKDNEVVERTLVNKASMNYAGSYFPDITVGVLDSDVPQTIGFASVLPEDWRSYMNPDYPGTPCLALDQEEKALVTNLVRLDGYAQFAAPQSDPHAPFFENIISGDSGNPAFMVVDGCLVLLTVWTFGGAGSGTSLAAYRKEINQMMSDLGGGYQLTVADLSGFRRL